MKFISLALEIFGLLWLLLLIMIPILGGRILVQLQNPKTKEFENITDVTFNRKLEGRKERQNAKGISSKKKRIILPFIE